MTVNDNGIVIAQLVSMREDELFEAAKQLRVPYDLVVYVHEKWKTPSRKLRSRWSRNTERMQP